ncbi:MAG: Crp/Fnr family transcriptional regulator [Pseudorhodoplanes sp.]
MADFTVLLRKLNALHALSEEEQGALLESISVVRELAKGENIVDDGGEPKQSTVILSGVACRYKILADGRRQILAFQFPGDVTDLYSYVLKKMDHGVGCLTPCQIAHIPHEALERLCARYPNLAYTLWRDSLVDAAILNMAIVNNGRRSAIERIAHLLCEQYARLLAVGLAERGRPVSFNITQTDVADATGLSLVHVNKTLRKFKDQELLRMVQGKLVVLDWKGMREAADFDQAYLHFKNVEL